MFMLLLLAAVYFPTTFLQLAKIHLVQCVVGALTNEFTDCVIFIEYSYTALSDCHIQLVIEHLRIFCVASFTKMLRRPTLNSGSCLRVCKYE